MPLLDAHSEAATLSLKVALHIARALHVLIRRWPAGRRYESPFLCKEQITKQGSTWHGRPSIMWARSHQNNERRMGRGQSPLQIWYTFLSSMFKRHSIGNYAYIDSDAFFKKKKIPSLQILLFHKGESHWGGGSEGNSKIATTITEPSSK